MKKITLLFLFAGLFLQFNHLYSQCTTFSGGGPWTNFDAFGGAPCDNGSGCPFNEITDFQIWADESYLMNNIVAGNTYTFSACNGSGAGSWPISFTIIAPSGNIDAFGLDGGSQCALTWTATENGTYEIGISESGIPCDTSTNKTTDNGYPAITCSSGSNCAVCSETSPPSCASTPTPPNGALNVTTTTAVDDSRQVAFSWGVAIGAESYDFYFDGSFLGNIGDNSVNIYGLDYSTEYSWSIVPVNCFDTATGCAIWNFTTEADPALSIEDNELNLIRIFPNPTKGIVNIDTNLKIDNITIFNQLGQNVIQVKGEQISNNKIDLSKLSNGLYFMNISAEDKTQSFKIIKE